MIIINFKAYEEATGKRALSLAKSLEKEAKKHKIPLIICPQFTNIKEISKAVKIPVYAQHADPLESGAYTGFISMKSLKEAGAKGILLNHSEHRSKKLDLELLKRTISLAERLNLKTVVFARDIEEAKKIKKLNPRYLAIEPPELIGGKISVSEDKPELIKKSAKAIGKKLLVGAGIHKMEDVRVALELGASGVVVSSGIVKAKNPQKVLADLANGFR